METTIRQVKRVYKARTGQPGGTMYLEVTVNGKRCFGLARVGDYWHEVHWYKFRGHRGAWDISCVELGGGMKQHIDWSIRGWLDNMLRSIYGMELTDQDIDKLASDLEQAAGCADSGPHERYQRDGSWVNGFGVQYPYGMFWRTCTG